MKLALLFPLLLGACASVVQHDRPTIANDQPIFELIVDSPKTGLALVRISVPRSVRKFVAPEWYGGAPMFLNFVTEITAADSAGKRLAINSQKNALADRAEK